MNENKEPNMNGNKELHEAYEKFINGMSISDDELEFLHNRLSETVETISVLNNGVYVLFLSHMKRELEILNSYREARRRN